MVLERIKGPATFSTDGSLFAFKESEGDTEFLIIKSDTIEELMKFNLVAKVPKGILESKIINSLKLIRCKRI